MMTIDGAAEIETEAYYGSNKTCRKVTEQALKSRQGTTPSGARWAKN
jgi:hypothetical protein